jgi:hypothetical protein
MTKEFNHWRSSLDKSRQVASDLAEWYNKNTTYSTRVPIQQTTPNEEDRWQYVDDGDFEITCDGLVYRAESKYWPKIDFHSVRDVRYRNIIVDEAYKIKREHKLPLFGYHIVNSSETGFMFISPVTRSYWFTERKYDKVEGEERDFVFCPKEYIAYYTMAA